jgi:hypothetical protein
MMLVSADDLSGVLEELPPATKAKVEEALTLNTYDRILVADDDGPSFTFDESDVAAIGAALA